MRLKKCGEFMEKDGVVVKRPGKKFVCPPLPEKMKSPYRNLHGKARDDMDQVNSLLEINWLRAKKKEYYALKKLYYFQQLIRFIQRTSNRISRILSKNKAPVKVPSNSLSQ